MKMSYANFAVGLLYGFGLGVILEHADLVNLTSLSLLLGGLCLVPAVGWLETQNHRRRMLKWKQIRERGKLMFIASHYMVLRGGIFAFVVMLSLRGQRASWSVHEITIPVVLLSLAFIGVQEWRNCEQEFQIPASAQETIFGDD